MNFEQAFFDELEKIAVIGSRDFYTPSELAKLRGLRGIETGLRTIADAGKARTPGANPLKAKMEQMLSRLPVPFMTRVGRGAAGFAANLVGGIRRRAQGHTAAKRAAYLEQQPRETILPPPPPPRVAPFMATARRQRQFPPDYPPGG